MGYRTTYSLSLENGSEEQTQIIIEQLRASDEDLYYAFHEDAMEGSSMTGDEMDNLLKPFSTIYPELIFCLSYDGDNCDDKGYTYYKNGKMQYCHAVITYDEYDETKLV